MELKFECIHCGQHISATPEQIGATPPCPGCGQIITVPNPVELIKKTPVLLPEKVPQPLTWQGLLFQLILVICSPALVLVIFHFTIDSILRLSDALLPHQSFREAMGSYGIMLIIFLIIPLYLAVLIPCFYFATRNFQRAGYTSKMYLNVFQIFSVLIPVAVVGYLISWIILLRKILPKAYQDISKFGSSITTKGMVVTKATMLPNSEPLGLDCHLTKSQIFTARNMVYGSMGLFAVGLVTPCMTMTPHMDTPMGDIMKIIRIFSSSGEPQTISIIAGIMHMLSAGDVLLAVIIAGFSIVFPTYKLISMKSICDQCLQQAEVDHERIKSGIHLLATLGKWSMLDVLVLGMIVISFKSFPGGTTITLNAGAYAFAASVVLSMLATALIKKALEGRDT